MLPDSKGKLKLKKRKKKRKKKSTGIKGELH
jgi:hypothetical protein